MDSRQHTVVAVVAKLVDVEAMIPWSKTTDASIDMNLKKQQLLLSQMSTYVFPVLQDRKINSADIVELAPVGSICCREEVSAGSRGVGLRASYQRDREKRRTDQRSTHLPPGHSELGRKCN